MWDDLWDKVCFNCDRQLSDGEDTLGGDQATPGGMRTGSSRPTTSAVGRQSRPQVRMTLKILFQNNSKEQVAAIFDVQAFSRLLKRGSGVIGIDFNTIFSLELIPGLIVLRR